MPGMVLTKLLSFLKTLLDLAKNSENLLDFGVKILEFNWKFVLNSTKLFHFSEFWEFVVLFTLQIFQCGLFSGENLGLSIVTSPANFFRETLLNQVHANNIGEENTR